MATSEYCSCPPRLPTPTASHVAIASGVNHRLTSPRWTSARSYAGQFPTRYFVLYLGCTLDFTSRSCPFGRHDGQGRDEHLLPRTNAATTLVYPTTVLPEIPPETLAEWQRVVDLTARLARVPASLIMRTERPKHTVLVSSRTEGNPYDVGREYDLHALLYCQGVFDNDGDLVVEDATRDPVWAGNEDLADGMRFYIGYPLKWPSGEVFASRQSTG